MFGRATIAVPAPEPAPLTIPATAPLLTGRRAVVYVADASSPGTYEGREVDLGERRGDWYEVKSGLSEGEQVVSRGAFQIDSAIQIEGRRSMMTRASPVPPVPATPPAAWRKAFAPAVELYLVMTEHLAADDFAAARDSADALPDALGAVRGTELPAAVASAWTVTEAAVRTAAGEAAAAKEIEPLRTAFDRISATVVAFVRKNGSPLADPLDLVHCPMAFNNRGADWLQRKGAIRNPYFGARMLACGEVTETIPGEAAQAAEP
jgi:Cu(I)/Ag(I) efflux system membrane fusion protein